MTPIKPGNYNPVIYEYLRRYQEDPSSRIFAPLAEAYRKAGLIDEAIEIAREGLQVHPSFVGGRVALARALFDKKQYSQVVEELKPVCRDVPDNLVAQRLLAESHLMLGRVAEALDNYKMLLYFTPGDPEAARIVQELEVQAYEKGVLVLRTDLPKPHLVEEFNVKNASEAISSDPELKKQAWMRKIEILQSLLLRVDRYRAAVNRSAPQH